MDYQQQTLAVKNSIELVVVLYDGMMRFLHQAISCIESGDVAGRRENIKYTLDILAYLQGRLRADAGGQSAVTLSEFYAVMYSQCVIASRDGSVELLQETIRNIRNVRDAWQEISGSEAAQGMFSREQQTREERNVSIRPAPVSISTVAEEPVVRRWSA